MHYRHTILYAVLAWSILGLPSTLNAQREAETTFTLQKPFDLEITTVGSVNFGDLPFGPERDTMITIRSLDPNADIRLTEATLRANEHGAFSSALPEQVAIPPLGNVTHPIRFHPPATGAFTATLSLVFVRDDGQQAPETDTLLIPLRGSGYQALFRLDTASGPAGGLIPLTMRHNVTDAAQFSEGFLVRLRVDPKALYPREIRSAGPIGMSYSGTGDITVLGGAWSAPNADTALFTIVFRGLSTGEPDNPVEVLSIEFPGNDLQALLADGLVKLSGCGFFPAQRVVVLSVAPNPAMSGTSLSYRAPEGSFPTCALFDSRGERLMQIDLPSATGEEQVAVLNLDRLPRGSYVVEIRTPEGWSNRIVTVGE